ncbi:hypothetical protein N7492_006926 [Penicillium capsulatum]|uniref:N-acetyltransferase domain-containing protein n=1 Tax=Penicillium capsulatum TaxID=69766 RepID=A0A9W9HYV2_9EURO|nr:hypothetical protein N7492_006926 [Penicillium capsulatum]KAJ6116759.1 hypothetical protein N7512_006484 [Penicillium capsulatum]
MAAPHLTSEEVVLIPKHFPSPSHLGEIVERYKLLRLHGLKADPASFTSTYEQESQFPYETWQGRIINQGSKTFVAVTGPDKSPDTSDLSSSVELEESHGALQTLLRKEWAGIVTILGPVKFPEQSAGSATSPEKPWQLFIQDGKYRIPPATSMAEDLTSAHAVYLIVGMFVLPQSRRKGHAHRLLDAAAEVVKTEAITRGADKATITVEVQSGNFGGKLLYERAGYHVEDDAVAMQTQDGGESYVKTLAKPIDLNEL